MTNNNNNTENTMQNDFTDLLPEDWHLVTVWDELNCQVILMDDGQQFADVYFDQDTQEWEINQ